MMWDFIQTQILGMKWLNILIGELLSALGLDIDSRIGSGIHFFIYDVIKITILLCLLIFVISYIQSFFPPERSRKIMGGFHGIGANIVGALLGTVTPFCSCSSIPIFMGFTYGIYECRITAWSNILFFDLITDGGSGEPRTAYEYLWRTDSYRLCCDGTYDRCCRWYIDRETSYGRSGRGFYQECKQQR